MKGKQFILLFLALLLPVTIFLFLKFFGKNEFDVEPLYVHELPKADASCFPLVNKLPYTLPDTITSRLFSAKDASLSIVHTSMVEGSVLYRLSSIFNSDPVAVTSMDAVTSDQKLLYCLLFLKEPFDVVVVDRKGAIRGQYASGKRDEVERLITEVTIILKKY